MQSKNFLVISEAISLPFDEGFKNVVYHIIQAMEKRDNVCVVTDIRNNTAGMSVEKVKLNKLFMNAGLRTIIREYSPDVILYIPEASRTLNSFIRAKVLKNICVKAKVAILAIQHRSYLFFIKRLIGFLKPDLLLLLDKTDMLLFSKMNFKLSILPPVVDKEKFCAVKKEAKLVLRQKYKIPLDKTIITHVGHIKPNRNLKCLIDLQKSNNVQVVVVGSTTTKVDERLKSSVIKSGIIVIDDYLSDIQEIYQLSDIYIFPVLNKKGAIDMPLSILEALACNLAVLTTPFGALPYYFKEDRGFRYFNTSEELSGLIEEISIDNICNNEKIKNFTWNIFGSKLIKACEEI